jgi:antirestriction protein ArdC
MITTDYQPRDYCADLTNRILEKLEQGVKPWVRPWDETAAAGPMAPVNAITGRPYRGINTIILGMDGRAFETGDPRWATFNQGKAKGWMVRKGEKATTIFFYKPLKIEDDRAEDGERTIPLMKAFPVFHASQFDGIPARVSPTVTEAPWTMPEAAGIILANSGAVVRIGGNRAFYSPSTDHIQLPPTASYHTAPDAAATALHELAHWTGHPRRLNRDLQGRFGSGAYAQEELRAELASFFTGSTIGIPTEIANHASYIASWIKALKSDKREIFRAAADAQKITDMQLSFHPDYAAKMKAEASEPEEAATPAVVAAAAKPASYQSKKRSQVWRPTMR